MYRSGRLLQWWLLIPIILVIMAVGASNLDVDYIWIDELSSIGNIGWLAGYHYNPLEVVQSVGAKSPAHPPAYFILLSIWSAFTGWTSFALRAFSLLMGLLSIAVAYQCGRVWLPRHSGLYVAILMGWGAFFVYYTHELRMYTQLAFFAALTLWAYGRIVILKKQSRSAWIFLFISTLGLIYTHYFGLLLAAGIGAYHVIFETKNRRWVVSLLVMGSAGLLFLPWFSVLQYGAERNADWISREAALTPIGILSEMLQLYGNGQMILILLMLALAISSLFVFWRSSHRLWLILVLTFVAVVTFNAIIPTLPPGRVRYLIIFWPLLALLVGLALEVIQQWRGARVAGGLLILWMVMGVSTFQDPEAQPQGSGLRTNRYPPLNRIIDEMTPRAHTSDLLISFSDTIAYQPYKFNSIGEFYLGPIAGDLDLVQLLEVSANEDLLQIVRDKLDSRVTVWLVSEPDLAPDVVALYREALEQNHTLCDMPVNDSELRIERYDLTWFDCTGQILPTKTLVEFDGGITLHGLKLFSQTNHELQFASAWTLEDSVSPETYSASFKLWHGGPAHLTLADFGLRYPGTGWYTSSLSIDSLSNGPYYLTVTVYNWKTGERLEGAYGDEVGSEIPVVEFQLPLEGVFQNMGN